MNYKACTIKLYEFCCFALENRPCEYGQKLFVSEVSHPRGKKKMQFFSNIGTLRIMLLSSIGVVILFSPFADGNVYAHDWRIVYSVVAPTFTMMLVFAVPLDMTMTRVFMSGANDTERKRLRKIIRIEASAYLLMLLAWTPFFVTVLGY